MEIEAVTHALRWIVSRCVCVCVCVNVCVCVSVCVSLPIARIERSPQTVVHAHNVRLGASPLLQMTALESSLAAADHVYVVRYGRVLPLLHVAVPKPTTG